MQKDLFEKLEPLARLAILIIPQLENGRFESFIAKAEAALDRYMQQNMEQAANEEQILTTLVNTQPALPKPFSDPLGGRYTFSDVMPQKEAYRRLGISESKMKLMRRDGEFTVLRKDGDEQLTTPQVWLLRTEVEAKRISYSVPKGRV